MESVHLSKLTLIYNYSILSYVMKYVNVCRWNYRNNHVFFFGPSLFAVCYWLQKEVEGCVHPLTTFLKKLCRRYKEIYYYGIINTKRL